MTPRASVVLLLLPALCVGEPVHMPLTRRSGVRTVQDHFAAADRARARYGFPTSKNSSKGRRDSTGFAIVNQVGIQAVTVTRVPLKLLLRKETRVTSQLSKSAHRPYFPSAGRVILTSLQSSNLFRDSRYRVFGPVRPGLHLLRVLRRRALRFFKVIDIFPTDEHPAYYYYLRLRIGRGIHRN